MQYKRRVRYIVTLQRVVCTSFNGVHQECGASPSEFLQHVHVRLTHTSVGSRVRTKHRNSETNAYISYSHVRVCMVHMYTVGTKTTKDVKLQTIREILTSILTCVFMIIFQQNPRNRPGNSGDSKGGPRGAYAPLSYYQAPPTHGIETRA